MVIFTTQHHYQKPVYEEVLPEEENSLDYSFNYRGKNPPISEPLGKEGLRKKLMEIFREED